MEDNLWNDVGDMPAYENNKELFQTHLLEQYKLYVEMADKISERRNLTNGFFLSLNILYISILGFMIDKIQSISSTLDIIYFLFIGVLLCSIWWMLLKSYRDLNSAKFKVIGKMEKKLPCSPYWVAEWNELGQGKEIRKYFPLTHLEKFIPIAFIFMYIIFGLLFINSI